MLGRQGLSKRIDRRHEELLAAFREDREQAEGLAAERWRSWMEEREAKWEEREARWERQAEESREFQREILLRNEKVYTEVLARLERLGERMDAGTRQLRENTAEKRAQTQAVLRLLDRFGEPDDKAA